MEINNIENTIKEKFQNRTFMPSNSAWQRLALELEEQSIQKKKSRFFYAGIAASVLILFSIGFTLFTSSKNQFLPINEVVIGPVDTILVDSKLNALIKSTAVNEAVVSIEEVETMTTTHFEQSDSTKSIENIENASLSVHKSEITNPIAAETLTKLPENELGTTVLKTLNKLVIKVDADDLLFAVTHTQQEIETYYTKNNINRKKLLQTIENQLQASNVNVSATSILAEVEQDIDEDTFKNNFLQMIKKKVFDVTTAVASRNN